MNASNCCALVTSIVERRGHLHHQRHVELGRAVVRVGHVLGACDLAFAEGVVAVDVDVRPVEGAKAALGVYLDQDAVIVVEGQPAQLGCGRAGGLATGGAVADCREALNGCE